MRFQVKLITIYAVFMFFAAIIIGTLIYRYNVQQLVEKELESIELISLQTTNQVLDIVDLMKYRTDTLLADPNTRNSLKALSLEKDFSDEYVRAARNTLQSSLLTDSSMSKFYRVIIFNKSNEFIATKTVKKTRLISDINWNSMTWLERAESNKGKPILVAAHEDSWSEKDNIQVFSLVRAVQGTGLGYIEVELAVEDLASQVKLPDDNLEIVILINGYDILYSNSSNFSSHLYDNFIQNMSEGSSIVGVDDGADLLVSKANADLYGLSVIILKSEAQILKDNRYLLTMVILVVFLFYIISLGFIILLSIFLTKPLKNLRVVMEQTELNNIDDNIIEEFPNDEIMALSLTYQSVLERLKNTLEEEKQIIMLQMEAQYDLLQAQVNPHFLFNVLNVISNKGLVNNDESICEICGNLADMLRYSTNVKDKYATVESEIEYVKQYLNILSSRFEHKLEFDVDCDRDILSKIIPKITIQQFVENSINHAFRNTAGLMKIKIRGVITEEGWAVTIDDNGCGFTQIEIDDFNNQFFEIKSKIKQSTGNIELEIGGMGLANTYARMYLLYGERFEFLIANSNNGAKIKISVKNEEVLKYV